MFLRPRSVSRQEVRMLIVLKLGLFLEMFLFLVFAWRYILIMIDRLPPPTYRKEAPNSSFGYTDYHGKGWLQSLMVVLPIIVLPSALEAFSLGESDALNRMFYWVIRLGVFGLLNLYGFVMQKAKKPEHKYDFYAVDAFGMLLFAAACNFCAIFPLNK